ncbi:hypothetical protein B0J14DRAFT_699512 [Halenospora varia]|nr:hypothetical protein B0J14DRAFT_699512 [Halenospora varia]
MSSLSAELLSVLDPGPDCVALQNTTSYRKHIKENASTLDEIEAKAGIVRACDALHILFADKVITPETSSYTEEKQVNWSTTCWLPAACIVKLENTAEVALALRIVTFTNVKFAVRGAGHNSNPGFASIGEDGVLLDVKALNQVTLSEDHKVCSVGPGATWEKVYEELEKNELVVVGGRSAGVGVGGLILGGGMSHFSNHWGMVCDNVKSYEVVLADSRVVNANAKEHPDLFRALKGGGANFGIATRFDLIAYADHEIWYTLKLYGSKDIEKVMKAAVEVQKAMDEDDRIGFFLSVKIGFLITELSVLMPETLGTQHSLAFALSMADAAKRETGTAAVGLDLELYKELCELLQSIATSDQVALSFAFQPIGKAAVEKGKVSGGNSMNIPPINQSWLGIMVEWKDDTDDEKAHLQIEQFVAAAESKAKSRGLLQDFKFMNDAGYSQNVLEGYGQEAIDHFTAIGRKYDPHGVFARGQNDGFLVPR